MHNRFKKFISNEKIAGFARSSDGSVTVLALFMFLMMVFVGGMAVDLMRFETRRAALQNAVDSGVLAAANLRYDSDCEALIRDFVAKYGYDSSTVTPDCAEQRVGTDANGNGGTAVSRLASANYRLDVDTIFMKMLGINVLKTGVASSAFEEDIPVEISLVLDISGSMRFDAYGATPSDPNGSNRINDLKAAVQDFLKVIYGVTCDPYGNNCVQSPDTGGITVNIIPYAGHVNPGPELFELMGGNAWHRWSHCKEVTNDDFDDADLPDDTSNQLPHFMEWTIDAQWMNWGWCPKDDAAILVMGNDYNTLNDYVQNLKLHDGTATHVGMKYGVALLNPTSRDEVAALATQGLVDTAYAARPANWEDDVQKIVILMTDGRTTNQVRPHYPAATGGVRQWNYELIADAQQSIGIALGTLLTGPELAEDLISALDDDAEEAWEDVAPILDRFGTIDSELNINSAAHVESGYPQTSTFSEGGSAAHSTGNNEKHITAMCDEAKTPVYDASGAMIRPQRISVYTIAYLAPTAAQDLMRDCASTPSQYYEIGNLDISRAFRSIAGQISKVRLTQ